MDKPPIGIKCPNCGELAPYGEERITWLGWHIDNPIHCWWWIWKKRTEKPLEVFPSPYRPTWQLVLLLLFVIVIGFLLMAVG